MQELIMLFHHGVKNKIAIKNFITGLVLYQAQFLFYFMPAIKHYLVIESSPQKVYEAITTRKGIANWWTLQTEIGDKIGDINVFDFGNRYHNEMEMTDLQPGKRVEWKCLIGDKEWIGTNLVFELEEKNGETILRFEHNNWKDETDFFASCNFQWAYYLVSLKQYCQTGKGTPFEENSLN